MLHAKYYQFYSNFYSGYYKTHFLNKNEENILKKYIFVSMRVIFERTELVVTVLENLNEWHIQSSLQIRGTYRLFYKYDSSSNEFCLY